MPLSLLSTAPATVLDCVQLVAYLGVMLLLIAMDVLLSPTVTDAIYTSLHASTRRDLICGLLRGCWYFAHSIWSSPLSLAILHVVSAVRILNWSWSTLNTFVDSLPWYVTFGSHGVTSISVAAAVSISTWRQTRKWFARLEEYRLDDIIRLKGTRTPTQGELCSIGFQVSDLIRRWRPPLEHRTCHALRALVFVLLLASQAWPLPTFAAFTGLPWHRGVAYGSTCTSFNGFPVGCAELQRVRDFNSNVMPRLQTAGIASVRKAATKHGLHGHVWHVGHACPDPSKSSARNDEDYGWNLFAQHAVDNGNLGHCLVTCAEAEHVGANHVRCTHGEECIRQCTRADDLKGGDLFE